MTRILFVHRHGPGQFVHLATHLAQRGEEVTLLCESADQPMPGVRVIRHRQVGQQGPDGTATDYHLRLGTEVAHVLAALRRQEGAPDLIVGHGGWGSLLFAKDVFPATPQLNYCEFFYQPKGADVGFDPEAPTRLTDVSKLKARNFAQISTLMHMDAGISPTQWQKSLFPKPLRHRIGVVHDGIDTGFCRPDAGAGFTLPDGRTLRAGDPVVTYAARNLEPYRGFPQFMRAAAELARTNPHVVFLVAGGEATSYGPSPADGRTWRQVMMDETGMDPARIHFLGTLPHAELIRLFQVSAAHVYLTYPFVLSWSMLEAMASGALIVGSATAPVTEYITHGRNGLLVPFFDTQALTQTLRDALQTRQSLAPMRAAARRTVEERARLEDCLQLQVRALATVLARSKTRSQVV
ncbi:glycosyltransferase family 4 protein [uncultured Devosia sp.]|uniref:glycosyltransferase family 4 protein n=1 Tax=uncultured Devosia sp. TaxID=211434 RepID=UPI0035CA80A9